MLLLVGGYLDVTWLAFVGCAGAIWTVPGERKRLEAALFRVIPDRRSQFVAALGAHEVRLFPAGPD